MLYLNQISMYINTYPFKSIPSKVTEVYNLNKPIQFSIYQCIVYKHIFTIYIYIPNNTNIEYIIRHVELILHKFIDKYKNIITAVSKRDIYLLLFSHEKKLIKHLDANAINSGYTYHNNGTIVIYRREELFKVLIHELIHSYNIDGCHDNLYYTNKRYKYTQWHLNSSLPLRPFESFTEFTAIMLVIDIFYKDNYSQVYNIELLWSALQLKKILRHFGWISYRDYIINNNKYIFIQDTCALEYYLFKFVLLYFIEEIKYKNLCIMTSKDCNILDIINKYYKSEKLISYLDYAFKLKLSHKYKKNLCMTWHGQHL